MHVLWELGRGEGNSKGFSEVALKFSRSSEATKCDFDIEIKWNVIRVQFSAFLYPVQIQSHPHTTLQATRWGRADQPSNLSMFCLFFEVGPECPGKKRVSRPPDKGIWSTLFNFEVSRKMGVNGPIERISNRIILPNRSVADSSDDGRNPAPRGAGLDVRQP